MDTILKLLSGLNSRMELFQEFKKLNFPLPMLEFCHKFMNGSEGWLLSNMFMKASGLKASSPRVCYGWGVKADKSKLELDILCIIITNHHIIYSHRGPGYQLAMFIFSSRWVIHDWFGRVTKLWGETYTCLAQAHILLWPPTCDWAIIRCYSYENVH